MKFLKQYWGLILLALAVGFQIAAYELNQDNNDLEKDLVMATYRKAWVDGANSATEATNNYQIWNDSVAQVQLKRDSLAFVGLIYSE